MSADAFTARLEKRVFKKIESRRSLLAVGGLKRRRMAEREGFEPSVRFTVHTLSRRAHSTALTPLRRVAII
jgi:hypothetical protein